LDIVSDNTCLISIVVATYNRAELLGVALESLIALEAADNCAHEIIVIDDASTDHTLDILRNISGTATVPIRYYAGDGQGVAQARNRGIQTTFGEWIAFFDDDQIAEPTWLRELMKAARETRALCVGGRIQLSMPRAARRLSPFCRSLLGAVDLADKPTVLKGKQLLGTGNVLIRRELFDQVGLFDESFTRGCEDADFFRRIRQKGFELLYTPEALAYHVIPDYRLKEPYLVWRSLRDGVNYAYLDRKEGGRIIVIYTCLLRLGQALLMNLPRLWLAGLKKDSVEATECRCLLARAYGYVRETLFLVAPKIFTQDRFFSRLEFRGERQTFRDIQKISATVDGASQKPGIPHSRS
jgi:succinoglycan biosynthesis protein ExoM